MLQLQPGIENLIDRHVKKPASSRSRAYSHPNLRRFQTSLDLDMPSILEPSTPRLRVCVIGAGLGGLTLAQLLMSAPGIKVTCYERSATLDDRLTGYRVMLSGSTLTTLKGKLWNEVWGHIALSIGEQPEGGQRLEFYKANGESMFNWDSEGMRDQFSVSRWQLRQGLLHRSEPFLRVGKMFVRYEELAKGGVRVYFSDGSHDECDLLVGADGWNSRVKRQLLPSATVKNTDMCVVYFKVPLTPKTLQALNHSSGAQMAFCPHNMNIILGAWQNPLAPYATRYTNLTIEPEESYIMMGVSTPVGNFHNRRCSPDRLSAAELKTEIISRTSNAPGIHPRFTELAQMACTNTAYIHMVRKVEAIKPWATQNITLLGDSVFNMSNMLGKGANCALLDAVSLAEALTSSTYNRRSPIRLTKYVNENIDRRMRERQRSALMQKLVFYGENKIKGFLRDKALPYTLKRIDGLDQESHSKMANGTLADWVADDEPWVDRSAVWAEELRWDEIYDEEHNTTHFATQSPPPSVCHACGSCGGSVAAQSVAGDQHPRMIRRSDSIGAPSTVGAASSIYSQASTMSPSYPADEATKYANPLGVHCAGSLPPPPQHMTPVMRGGVDLRAPTSVSGGDRERNGVESRASRVTTLVDHQEMMLKRRQSMTPISRSMTVSSGTSTSPSVSTVCSAHGSVGCPRREKMQHPLESCNQAFVMPEMHAGMEVPERSSRRAQGVNDEDRRAGFLPIV